MTICHWRSWIHYSSWRDRDASFPVWHNDEMETSCMLLASYKPRFLWAFIYRLNHPPFLVLICCLKFILKIVAYSRFVIRYFFFFFLLGNWADWDVLHQYVWKCEYDRPVLSWQHITCSRQQYEQSHVGEGGIFMGKYINYAHFRNI